MWVHNATEAYQRVRKTADADIRDYELNEADLRDSQFWRGSNRHGNALTGDRQAIGYTLIDRISGEPLHYGKANVNAQGKTTRWSAAALKRLNAVMRIDASGTDIEMHLWQHRQILDYKAATGERPPLNFNDW